MTLLWERRTVVGLAALLVSLYVLAFVTHNVAVAQNGWLTADALPFGGDFVAFWAGAVLALDGRAHEAFDPEVVQAVQQTAVDGSRARFLWNYPPTFLVLVAPLGLLGAVQAVFAWWGTTVPLYVAALWRVVPRWETLVLAFAGSATLLNLAHGQNGFFLTAAMVGGLAALDRGHPVLAGVLLGCLAVKPHYGVLLPFALGAAGRWRAFLATGAATLGWVLASVLLFGTAGWRAFVDNLPRVQTAIDQGTLVAEKLVTPYVLFRTLGIGGTFASLLQTGALFGAMLTVVWAYRRLGARPLAHALLLVATSLSSPYLFDYDLVLWSGAFAFAFADESPWGPAEKELWALAAVLPVAFVGLYGVLGVQLAPLLTVGLLVSLGVRVLRVIESSP